MNVGIFFGGKSAEHAVSIRSAQNVYKALDKHKFAAKLIYITPSGSWQLISPDSLLSSNFANGKAVSVAPGSNQFSSNHNDSFTIDVALPILHGTNGEDGTIQGLFELCNIPYAGPGVLASAACMDKSIAKQLLVHNGIATAKAITVTSKQVDPVNIITTLGLPLFVKPANMGSSIGVTKVTSVTDLLPAIRESLRFDSKVLIEEAITGDEIECAVLGNAEPKASGIGRIIPKNDFYSYHAKYLSDDEALLEIPAKIPAHIAQKAQILAIEAYKALGCEGMARIDMFATKDGTLYVNEINTLPGFTSISMYPKLWEIAGIPYSDLLSSLISLALERAKKQSQRATSYE